MALNTNPIDRVPGRQGIFVTEVFQESDLGVESGGIITVTSGHYIIKETISTGNRIEFDPDANVIIEMESRLSLAAFEYSGTDALFSGTMNSGPTGGTIQLENLFVLMSGANGEVFNISGGNGFVIEGCAFVGDPTGGLGYQIGFVEETTQVVMRSLTVLLFGGGLAFTDVPSILINGMRFTPLPGSSGTMMSVFGRTGRMDVIEAFVETQSLQSLFYLDPLIEGPVDINLVIDSGEGVYFESGITGDINSFADQSSTLAIISVLDNTVAQFTAVPPGDPTFKVGALVVHTGFSNAAYNGTFVINNVPGVAQYEVETLDGVPVLYATNANGTAETQIVQVTASAIHGLSNGDTIQISDTVFYNGQNPNVETNYGGYEITVFSATEFLIYAVFVATDTGSFDSGSITEANMRVNVKNAGTQKESMTIGAFAMSGNNNATPIINSGQYEELNLGTPPGASPILSQSNELFTLSDTPPGELRYDGLNPISVNYTAIMTAESGSNNTAYAFKLTRNGADLDIPDSYPVDSGVDVQASGGTLISVMWPITLDPGDLIKMEVACEEAQAQIQDITFTMIRVFVD